MTNEALTQQENTEPRLNSDVATVDEVARMLRVNRKTIYEAVERDEIPHRRIGRIIRFDVHALKEWLGGDGTPPRSKGAE